jgi:hypothetical protein
VTPRNLWCGAKPDRRLARVLSLFDITLGYGRLAALACAMTLDRARNPRTLASS